MNISEILSFFADGAFEVPVQRELRLGEQILHTGGVLKGSIRGGTIEFEKPYPRATVTGCVATVTKVEPEPPDAAMVYATVPVIGRVKRRIRIEESE